MDPQVAAHRLTEIALLLEVRGENPFKTRAFVHAARTIGELEQDDIAPMVRSKEIASLPGIGSTTLAVLADLVETGDSTYLDALRETTPKGLIEMMRVPGLGPTRIHRIHESLGIATIEELEAAARDGRLAKLSGFGPKTADKILRGIITFRETAGQVTHTVARPEAKRLQRALAKVDGIDRVEVAGAVRRTAEVVGDLDLVAGCSGEIAQLARGMTKVPGVEKVEGADDGTLALRLINGMRARLHCVPDAAFPIALWRVTGSKEHYDAVVGRLRDKGFSIRDDRLVDPKGKIVRDADEEEIYRSAGLELIPLELREGRGEVQAAETGSLPDLIEPDDLRGVLHCHSEYSDGSKTIAEMAEAARERGWTYLGISDHSQAASYAGGLTRDAVLKQHDEIDALNERLEGFRVLKGIEADILADGTVDFAADDLLDRFDYVIGSIHSRFAMGEKEMTERVLKAMSDPRLTIVGHPTGRLLLRREPFAVDMNAMMEMAVEQGIALELNCDPNRLDLDWRWVQEARKKGVTIEIGPDAHSPSELGFVDFGMQIARKGWLEKSNVLNTGSADDVLRFARARREGKSTRKAKRGS
jgi:DNA polymerase (family 10)